MLPVVMPKMDQDQYNERPLSVQGPLNVPVQCGINASRGRSPVPIKPMRGSRLSWLGSRRLPSSSNPLNAFKSLLINTLPYLYCLSSLASRALRRAMRSRSCWWRWGVKG